MTTCSEMTHWQVPVDSRARDDALLWYMLYSVLTHDHGMERNSEMTSLGVLR